MEHYYDEEIEKVEKVGANLNEKYQYILRRMNLDAPMCTKNRELLTAWHDEVIHRYHQIGFAAECDITPALAGLAPPKIEIVGRLSDHEFDFDKKKWEVLKSRENGKG